MKTILLTGSNSAIGAAVAKALVEQPVQLALHYFSNQAKADELKAWLDEQDIANKLFQADLTDHRQAESLVADTVREFGGIDVLINVVGPFVHKDILEVGPEQWLSDINLNLNSCFHTSHYALEELRRNRGQIINFAFSGVDNIKAWPMSTGYCAAKTGVVALSKSLAVALAPYQVRVNTICPGLTEDDEIGASERQAMASQIPAGRPVQPDEIGKTAAWLIFDSPEAMTGSLLTVSGGWEY
ncbi:SDR family NAD(P)-dependent oxidoreductase [Methylomarinum vadi]|uniref:SDR family NAD(P)-dependent oxidoreductase n=1 Tax=Methylomarinum vadi TaxID=438855 RepID=UPI0004DF93BA|nr:SDR family NAD(P)-dependent oxidoreductase [Methylomarinum vadi]